MTDEATNLGAGDAVSPLPGAADAMSGGDVMEIGLHEPDGEGLNASLAASDDAPGELTDIVEIEHDGETHHIPKALERAFLFQADYTRKTQELAQQRRAFDDQAVQFQHAQAVMSQGQVDLAMIDRQLDAYEALDWQSLYAEDPALTAQEHASYEDLQHLRAAVVDELVGAEHHAALETERATAIRLQDGLETLSRTIPNFGPELAGQLMTYGAQTYGFTGEELGGNQDPRLVQLLHDAYAGAQSLRAQRMRASQTTAPAATLRGGGGRFATDASTNDFAAFERMADSALRR